MNPFVLCRASRSGGEAMNSFAPLLFGAGASLALVSGFGGRLAGPERGERPPLRSLDPIFVMCYPGAE
jgi:hypothetical protein